MCVCVGVCVCVCVCIYIFTHTTCIYISCDVLLQAVATEAERRLSDFSRIYVRVNPFSPYSP